MIRRSITTIIDLGGKTDTSKKQSWFRCCGHHRRSFHQTKSTSTISESRKEIQHIQSFTLPPGSLANPNADYTGLSIWGSAEPLLNYLCEKYSFHTQDENDDSDGRSINNNNNSKSQLTTDPLRTKQLRILELGAGCGKLLDVGIQFTDNWRIILKCNI